MLPTMDSPPTMESPVYWKMPREGPDGEVYGGGGVQVVELLMRMLSLDNQQQQQEANLSEAVKLFEETKYDLLHHLPYINNGNIKGTRQGIHRFWFAFICFTLTRLLHADKTTNEALVVYHNIINFLDNLPRFFHNAAPALINIYGNTIPKYDIPNMSAHHWFNNVVEALPSEPSVQLEQFMLESVKEDIAQRAGVVLESVFSSSAIQFHKKHRSVNGDAWVKWRRIEALKVYYNFLGATCATEDNVASLLTNDLFHRCMLACSAELVLANTHHEYTIWFPSVLERSGITAYDFSKVIHCFLKHQLPEELRGHLNTLREKLLESMVWEKGSSLYDSLIVARPYLTAEINRLRSMAEPIPSVDEAAARSCEPLPTCQKHVQRRLNPSKRKRPLVERRILQFSGFELSNLEPPSLNAAFPSSRCQNPEGNRARAETVISYMFNIILQLAACRINFLVQASTLTSPMHFQETVDRLVQIILSQRTSLFFNRHLDQLIMCSFYSAAKLLNSNSTFKGIVHHYKIFLNNPQVCQSIILDWSQTRHIGKTGQDHVDVWTFYTEVFAQSVKPLLVELGLTDKSTGRSYAYSHSSPPDTQQVEVSSAHRILPASVDISKTLEFAADTIDELVKRLDLTEHIRETVYGVVQQLLIQQTTLFLNRHIDQIVLCSLFHLKKIFKLPPSFTEILHMYLKLPHGCTQVLRRVYVDWSEAIDCEETGQDHVDIFRFYKKVFAPAVKLLLLDLESAGKCSGPLLSPPGMFAEISTKSTDLRPKELLRPSDKFPVIIPLADVNRSLPAEVSTKSTDMRPKELSRQSDKFTLIKPLADSNRV